MASCVKSPIRGKDIFYFVFIVLFRFLIDTAFFIWYTEQNKSEMRCSFIMLNFQRPKNDHKVIRSSVLFFLLLMTSILLFACNRSSINSENHSEYDNAVITKINFLDENAQITGDHAVFENKTLTISAGGIYELSGVLNDGQIYVNAGPTDQVQLILAGLTVTCKDSAAIYIGKCDKIEVTLAEGTVNTLTDSDTYTRDYGENKAPNACLCARSDMTINGSGTLTVTGNLNNGIDTSKDLKIKEGNITVTARNNALKGNNSITITGGTLKITSRDDGVKVSNDIDSGKGFFLMEGGTLDILANDDGIQAPVSVTVTGGSLKISYGGKDINCSGTIDITPGCYTKRS